MSVTRDTSHSPIGPRHPVEQLPVGDIQRHSLTAVLRSARVTGENAAVQEIEVKWNAMQLNICVGALTVGTSHAQQTPTQGQCGKDVHHTRSSDDVDLCILRQTLVVRAGVVVICFDINLWCVNQTLGMPHILFTDAYPGSRLCLYCKLNTQGPGCNRDDRDYSDQASDAASNYIPGPCHRMSDPCPEISCSPMPSR